MVNATKTKGYVLRSLLEAAQTGPRVDVRRRRGVARIQRELRGRLRNLSLDHESRVPMQEETSKAYEVLGELLGEAEPLTKDLDGDDERAEARQDIVLKAVMDECQRQIDELMAGAPKSKAKLKAKNANKDYLAGAEPESDAKLVLARLVQIAQSIGLRIHSSMVGLAPIGVDIDPMERLNGAMGTELTGELRKLSGGYVVPESVHSTPEAELEYLVSAAHIMKMITSQLTKKTPTSGPGSLNGMDHQYALPRDAHHIFSTVLSMLQAYNAAHGSLAGVSTMREQIRGITLQYMNWQGLEYDNAAVVGVDSATRGNELGVRYQLRAARMGGVFIRTLHDPEFSHIEPIPVDAKQFERFLPPQRVHTIRYLQDLHPEEAAKLPLEVLSHCYKLFQQKLAQQYGKYPGACEDAYAEFASKMSVVVKDDVESGKNTVIFLSELLHYTLHQAIDTERRGEKVVVTKVDDSQRSDFQSKEAEIEQMVKEGKQVVLFAVAGNTSFGAHDDFSYLKGLKARLQQKYGRSFQVHSDAAWGWTLRSTVQDPHDGSIVPYAELQHEPYFAGDLGKQRYDSIVAMSEVSDSITGDAHKDAALNTAGFAMMKHGETLAPVLLNQKVPYLKIDSASGKYDADAVRVNLCSHPMTVTSYLYTTMVLTYRSGAMKQRHLALLNAAEAAQENLSQVQTLTLGDGTAVDIVPVASQTSRIMNFLFVPRGTTDTRVVDALNNYISEYFAGGENTDPKTDGIKFSSTVCSAQSCPTLKGMEHQTLPYVRTVRMCMVSPEQLGKDTKIPGWKKKDGHFSFVVSHLQKALAAYTPPVFPPPPINLPTTAPANENPMTQWRRSPIVRASMQYKHLPEAERQFLVDARQLLGTVKIPYKGFDKGHLGAQGASRFNSIVPLQSGDRYAVMKCLTACIDVLRNVGNTKNAKELSMRMEALGQELEIIEKLLHDKPGATMEAKANALVSPQSGAYQQALRHAAETMVTLLPWIDINGNSESRPNY